MTLTEEPLLCIVGPTASGKTALSLELCERLEGEVLSADSVQVYRGFDIGTGKPSAGELARAPHHFISIAEPNELWDAARFAQAATERVNEVRSRGRVPIVCGGSFLWVRALIHGLAEAPPADEAVRARHRALAEAEGRAALHAELGRVDPESAARLAPNDLMRVSRALEVFELTGAPLSQLHAAHGFRVPRFRARFLGVQREREELDRCIHERVRGMLAAGWVDEVRGLVSEGYGDARAMGSVGYRQVREALSAEVMPSSDELGQSIVRATRIFARRQRTWLRDQPVEWLAPGATKLP